jgi:rhodanese-related sulfurtransferase
MPAAAPTAAPALPALSGAEDEAPLRLTIEELKQLRSAGAPVVLLDVRTERSWDASERMARDAIRVPPDEAVERAAELALPRNAWLVAYCA